MQIDPLAQVGDVLRRLVGNARHIVLINQHGGGAGLCLAGVMPSGASHWSETEPQCTEFDAAVEWQVLAEPKPGAHMITCYTPAGEAIEVEARDEEHAEWIQRMNPRRECSGGLKSVKEFLALSVNKIEAMYSQNIENGWTPNNTQPTEVKPDSEAATRPEPLEGELMPREKINFQYITPKKLEKDCPDDLLFIKEIFGNFTIDSG